MKIQWRRSAVWGLMLISVAGAPAAAQESSRPLLWDVARQVALDPTTYVPAAAGYGSTLWDWKTSQPLFEHGWLERNPRYTVSGRSDDVPLDYAAGRREIARQSLGVLQRSLLNNAAVIASERLLARRYPEHRKLLRVLSWSERIAFGSYQTYVESISHIRQAQRNGDLARAYGY